VRIPVLPGDSPETLAERLLPREHRLLVDVLALCLSGRVAEQDEGVLLDGHPLFTPLQLDCGA
jgi:phosphoribosylglycinamide formyltransferase-1